MKADLFLGRHLGPNEGEIKKMLEKIGVSSLEQLLQETIPESIRLKKPLDLPKGISEYAFSKHIHALGKENRIFKTYIGLGYHQAVTTAVIQRNILENPGWYTAYTPYQAEIAQGRLEALFNFQTMVCDLTGMELANASLLDESTAAAEAMTMLFGARTKKQKKNKAYQFFVDENVLPQTLSLLQTRSTPLGIEIITGKPDEATYEESFFGALFQYTGKKGSIPNLKAWIETTQSHGVYSVVSADIMSLVLLESPGKFGADVVVGSTQRFGIPLGYGGPHAAYFAAKESFKRNMPGRIIGLSKDSDNNTALRMALQTREQHIKRGKATSNICTAQALLAVMASMYAVYHGPAGIKKIACHVNGLASNLASSLKTLGCKLGSESFFDTVWVKDVNCEKLKSLA